MKKTRDRLSALLILLCAAGIIACGAYLLYNYWYIPRQIDADNARYAAMYAACETPAIGATTAPAESAAVSPPDCVIAEPAATASPKPSVEAPSTSEAPEPEKTASRQPDAPEDLLLGTPGPDTIVYAAATLPPVQLSFGELLSMNPETVGFLTMGDDIALPVVQRENDNEYYLEHDFEGDESSAGCLFVDGANWLFPRDDCLYIYGHNMKNGAMFGHLAAMSTVSGLIANSPAYFDTIYENGVYVPFACVTLTADQSDSGYFELRNFDFTESTFAEYIATLKKRSLLNIPVDVEYGDRLLILVTCNYTVDDGRFAVAFRQLREGEDLEEVMRQLRLSTEN